jgi:hypothetical protein
MLQDVIERFRYRFELWRREQGADWKGLTGERVSAPSEEKPENSWQSVPLEKRAILTDSTPQFVVRTLVPYLAILVILVLSCRLLGTFVPVLAYACSIAAIVLGTVWTLINVFGTTHICKQRREYRSWRKHLTNQSS